MSVLIKFQVTCDAFPFYPYPSGSPLLSLTSMCPVPVYTIPHLIIYVHSHTLNTLNLVLHVYCTINAKYAQHTFATCSPAALPSTFINTLSGIFGFSPINKFRLYFPWSYVYHLPYNNSFNSATVNSDKNFHSLTSTSTSPTLASIITTYTVITTSDDFLEHILHNLYTFLYLIRLHRP